MRTTLFWLCAAAQRWQPQEAQMLDDGFLVDVAGGVPVVVAPEEIDITNAAALRSALLKAAASGPGALVVDMTRTRFCDSSGPHALVAAHQRAQAEGREVLLVIPSAIVLRVFALTGVDRMIPNFTSLAEALARPDAARHGQGQLGAVAQISLRAQIGNVVGAASGARC
jgi:anti-sigma B factor antagonist